MNELNSFALVAFASVFVLLVIAVIYSLLFYKEGDPEE